MWHISCIVCTSNRDFVSFFLCQPYSYSTLKFKELFHLQLLHHQQWLVSVMQDVLQVVYVQMTLLSSLVKLMMFMFCKYFFLMVIESILSAGDTTSHISLPAGFTAYSLLIYNIT